MTLFKHALKRSFEEPINIMVIFLLPIAALFIPAQGEGFPSGLSIYGMINLFSAFLLCKSIVDDRMNNIIIRIASTPTSYITYLWSHLLAYILILTLQNIIFIFGTFLFWKGVVFDHAIIFTLYLLFSIMSVAFSLCWNSLFRSFTISFGLFSGIGSVMCLVSGITIPLQIIPENIKKYVLVLPTYWLPYGLDSIYHGKINNVFIACIILLIYSGVLFLIGSRRRY